MPEEADVSVYLLFLGSRTLEPAQNKLLKLIEEPPANTVFVLVCESGEQLLPTIRSRVQSFTLRPPSEEAAAGLCAGACGGERGTGQGTGGAVRWEHWPHAGRTFRRGFRRGLRRRQADGKRNGRLQRACPSGSRGPVLKDRKLFREVLTRLSLIFRDALVLRMGGAAMLGGAPEEAQALCALPKRRLAALPGLAEDLKQRRTAMQIWLCW